MISVIFKNINQDAYNNTDAIDNVISYIYHANKSNLPIYCYGCIKWPPTYNSLIREYHYIRTTVELHTLNQQVIEQQIIHFVISFNISAGDIAQKHFHYAVSTASYHIENPLLTNDKMAQYTN